MKIQEIPFQLTFPVRHSVLRQGKPIETCFFEGDDFDTTVHFGLYFDNECIGVASIYSTNNSSFSQPNQYQLRGMAVLNQFQKQGAGAQLVLHVEHYLQSKGISLLWFNAREVAVPFYEKLGYTIKGPAFDIPSIGTHYVMAKKL